MKKVLKAAVVGLGQRGMQLIEPMLRMDDVRIVGVCDTYRNRVENAEKAVCRCGQRLAFTNR